ncbi:hypothetical protein RQP54_10620 [Curvibacter sp. APW13]|uniref:hypothetical protein n=1 Tax=Curvibacter sp. APW13 TaxID=3077236 RepID=UPI0028DEDFAE|nr:hypothetical protein [Curvibacter sp. APW13]MDT8991313.1 hypothetical protein [Curvibacter sp. APW13]
MKRWLSVLAWMLVSAHAGAMELFEDGKFVAQAQPGYAVAPGDTLAGSTIYRPAAALLSKSGIAKATGGMFDKPMPWAVLVYADDHHWDAIQTMVVSVGADETNAWLGDPCEGESIVKINRVRGRLDRCAVARFKPLDIGGQQQTVLQLVFVESNVGGRRYELHFLVNLMARGVPTLDLLADSQSKPHVAMRAWMGTMLDAVVSAASHGKPTNAFDGVLAPWTVLAQ